MSLGFAGSYVPPIPAIARSASADSFETTFWMDLQAFDPAAAVRPEMARDRCPAPKSVEPLSASADLLMKRAVPTLRFFIRKPRFPQVGLSPFLKTGYCLSRLACAAIRCRLQIGAGATAFFDAPDAPREIRDRRRLRARSALASRDITILAPGQLGLLPFDRSKVRCGSEKLLHKCCAPSFDDWAVGEIPNLREFSLPKFSFEISGPGPRLLETFATCSLACSASAGSSSK